LKPSSRTSAGSRSGIACMTSTSFRSTAESRRSFGLVLSGRIKAINQSLP
jgi:hypothetical protein